MRLRSVCPPSPYAFGPVGGGDDFTLARWNCSSIFSSLLAAISMIAQPQTPGRSSIALDRTKVRLQSRAYTRPASMHASYRVLKLAEVVMATALNIPPEIPIRCVSGLPSPGLSNSGSRFAVLWAVSKRAESESESEPGRTRTSTAAPLSQCREACRGPSRFGHPNDDISGRALGSWNKFRSSPARSGPYLSPRP